jgi:hypothetical protein
LGDLRFGVGLAAVAVECPAVFQQFSGFDHERVDQGVSDGSGQGLGVAAGDRGGGAGGVAGVDDDRGDFQGEPLPSISSSLPPMSVVGGEISAPAASAARRS